MRRNPLPVKRSALTFKSDSRRVIARFFPIVDRQKTNNIIRRVLHLSDIEAARLLDQTLADFSNRHRDINGTLVRHYRNVEKFIDDPGSLTDEKKRLIGSCFTMEYSVESAALFNPSIVPDPDQTDLPPGHLRVILTFRAAGEGHVSSIEFRRATINNLGEVDVEPVSPFLVPPEPATKMCYDKSLFGMRLIQMNVPEQRTQTDLSLASWFDEVLTRVLSQLGGQFTYHDLRKTMAGVRGEWTEEEKVIDDVFDSIDSFARSNYEIRFQPDIPICERVLFPAAETEPTSIEDARFVRFIDDENRVVYYATCVACRPAGISTELIETHDFVNFRISTISGKVGSSKGMCLFPRKVNGQYAMLSRFDGENSYLMYSDDLHVWNDARKIQEPMLPWELVQIGNCGSPIETEAGWLVLTHGVGPMRRYCIGAMLLDLDDPSRALGQLEEPIFAADVDERDGYVPNVAYTCGALVHNGELIIPYATSDSVSRVATVPVGALLSELTRTRHDPAFRLPAASASQGGLVSEFSVELVTQEHSKKAGS